MTEFVTETVLLQGEDLQCCVCKEYRLDIWCRSKCAHNVCKVCLKQIQGTCGQNNVMCPSCRGTGGTWLEHVLINRLVGGMRISCPYKCDSVTSFKEHEKHKAECMQRPSKCPNLDCDWTGTWASRLDHVDACVYALIECEHCHNPIHRGAIDDHVKVCNYAIDRCIACLKTMPAWKIRHHRCEPFVEEKEREKEKGEDDEEEEEMSDLICDGCGLTRGGAAADEHHVCLGWWQPRVPASIVGTSWESEWMILKDKLENPMYTDQEKSMARLSMINLHNSKTRI